MSLQARPEAQAHRAHLGLLSLEEAVFQAASGRSPARGACGGQAEGRGDTCAPSGMAAATEACLAPGHAPFQGPGPVTHQRMKASFHSVLTSLLWGDLAGGASSVSGICPAPARGLAIGDHRLRPCLEHCALSPRKDLGIQKTDRGQGHSRGPCWPWPRAGSNGVAPALAVRTRQGVGPTETTSLKNGAGRGPVTLFYFPSLFLGSCSPVLKEGSPYPSVPHKVDCRGPAEGRTWCGRRSAALPPGGGGGEPQWEPIHPVLVPTACPLPPAKAPDQVSPADGQERAKHLCLCPAPCLRQLQLAPKMEYAVRRPGQLLGQPVVGLLHVPQLFPQKGVHLGEPRAPGRADTTAARPRPGASRKAP